MKHNKRLTALLAGLLAVSMLFSGCSGTTSGTSDTGLIDGTYEGTGAGYGGNIKLALTVEGGKITKAEVLEHSETEGVSDPAFEQIPAAIVEKQGAEGIETVAGCTRSSEGLLAAAEAALVLAKGGEAAKVPTGTMGGGTLSGTGTKMQIESGITDDTPEKFFDDFVRLNAGYQEREGVSADDYYWNQSLGMYYAQHSGECVDWIVEDLGATVKDRTPSQPTLYEPLNTPRVWSGDRSSYDKVLKAELQKYIDSGMVEVLLNTKADELIMDGEAVVGVKTTNTDGVQMDYKAKATILCTGGYGYSEELVKKYNFQNFTTTAPSFATGDGFFMAEQAGGVLKNMDFLTAYAGGLKVDDSLTKKLSIRVKDFPYIIFVNENGERFVDELGNEDGSSYDEITSWWKKGDNRVWIMLDQAMVDDLKAQNKPIISGDTEWKNFDEQLANGTVLWSGSTIAEVAEKAGINGENLEKTIEKYNEYAKNGYDEEFGRTRLMKEFTGGTYYIFETTPYIMITAGGPDMNDKGQVVNANGEAIPGLYQAGEIVGMANAFGRTTIGGVGNTGCLVWGRLAGGSAAEYALEA